MKHSYLSMKHLYSGFYCGFFRATVAQQRTVFWVNVKSTTLTRGRYSTVSNQQNVKKKGFDDFV